MPFAAYPLGDGLEELSPPLCKAELKDCQREAVTGGVLGWDGVPTKVFDGDTRLARRSVDVVESHVQFGFLTRGEIGVAPGEFETAGWIPDADTADDERLAVRVGLHESPVGAGFEGEGSGAPLRELEQSVGLPPLADLFGEGSEGSCGSGGHPECHEDTGGVVTCHARGAAKAVSCSAQARSAMSSQLRSSVMGAERSV